MTGKARKPDEDRHTPSSNAEGPAPAEKMPEGLKRERKDPLNPSTGRRLEGIGRMTEKKDKSHDAVGTEKPWKEHANDEETGKTPPNVIEQENRKTQDK